MATSVRKPAPRSQERGYYQGWTFLQPYRFHSLLLTGCLCRSGRPPRRQPVLNVAKVLCPFNTSVPSAARAKSLRLPARMLDIVAGIGVPESLA